MVLPLRLVLSKSFRQLIVPRILIYQRRIVRVSTGTWVVMFASKRNWAKNHLGQITDLASSVGSFFPQVRGNVTFCKGSCRHQLHVTGQPVQGLHNHEFEHCSCHL